MRTKLKMIIDRDPYRDWWQVYRSEIDRGRYVSVSRAKDYESVEWNGSVDNMINLGGYNGAGN